jgi:hydrogenase-4 component B
MGSLAILVVALAGLAAFLASRARRAGRALPTWDCGYVAASPRVQYTASSFGASIAALLPGFLRADVTALPPDGVLPGAASFRTGSSRPDGPDVVACGTGAPDPFGARLYEPFVDRVAERLGRLRWLQKGQLTLYLVYIFVATLATLAWSVVRPYVR